MSPEWRLKLSFGTKKKCPFPLNRDEPSLELTDTKTMWTLFWDHILCPLSGGVPWISYPHGEFPLYFLCPFYPPSLGRLHLLEGCVSAFPFQKVFSVKALAQILYIYSCYVHNFVDSQVVFCRRHLINIQAYRSLWTPPCYVVGAYKKECTRSFLITRISTR